MIRRLRGMTDILPGKAGGNSELRQFIELKSREIFCAYNYNEIETPVLEEKALFVKSVGEETDIVTKEMFEFRDRGDREVALRPEGTAPIVRAYLERDLQKIDPFQKFYYIGPMFRAERPQAGRLRQFHQIGAEAIGSLEPALDAEMVILLSAILDAAGVDGYTIRLNNLGCKDDKARLSKNLKTALSVKKQALCEDCRKRLEKNPLRVIDCKNESCRVLVRAGLTDNEFRCRACTDHFDKVKSCLEGRVKYEIDPYIVRGLDYYTSTVFEVFHSKLGSQDAIGAGGRYDNLISDMGGPKLGAVGFALGVERILIALAKQGPTPLVPKDKVFAPLGVYITTLGEEARRKGFALAGELRQAKISSDMDYEGKSLKAQMRAADRLSARFVIIIGEDEIKNSKAILRNMATKGQQDIAFENMAQQIKKLME